MEMKGDFIHMPDPDPTGNTVIAVLLSLLFLLLTVILSVGDEALGAVGDARVRELEEDGDRRARRIRRLTEQTHRLHTRVAVGYLLFCALTVCAVVHAFGARLRTALFPAATGAGLTAAAVLSLFLLVTVCVFALLVFGYILPRRLTEKDPEKVALSVGGLFRFVLALTAPLYWLCALAAVPFLRIGGIDPHADPDTVTEEDIRELVDAGEEIGAIEGAQKEMVNNIFEFDDITAAEIMTPRTDVTAIEADDPIEEALTAGVDGGYSRIPVYDGDIDHIIGILYIKDLLPYVGRSLPEGVTIRHLLREAHFVPDTKKGNDLFEEMNEKHIQMAIVVDEYGGVAGIVTMEDLLESIVGNMQDEFDNETDEITRLDDDRFVVDGSLAIGDLEELLDIELPQGDYDTVAGFLMDQLGHIPEQDEHATVRYENVTFTIEQMDDRRIERVLIQIDPPGDAEEPPQD